MEPAGFLSYIITYAAYAIVDQLADRDNLRSYIDQYISQRKAP